VEPLSTALGAEISGVDLAEAPPERVLAEIRHAFGEHGVIFFRDQQLTPQQHLSFAQRFGGIDLNRFFATVPGYPMIAEVRKEPEQRHNIGNGWHTDHSYDLMPALGSMLYAREVPTTRGDTLFASMYAAYDALSEGLKATLDGLRALHSSRHVFGAEADARRGDLRGRIGNPELADAGRGPPRRHPPSRDRPQGALCKSGVHGALRRLDRGGITPSARVPLPARGSAGIHLPVPLA
jgi:taurine dioxygenase